MLTLKNLKSMVEDEPRIKSRMPSIKQLEEAETNILVREMVSDMQITVYQNGYVACRRGRDATVFRLKDCGVYTYGAAMAENEYAVGMDVFENERWYIRLYLEAEDRLNANYERKQRHHQISLDGLYADHCSGMGDLTWDGLTDLIEREEVEQVRKFLNYMTENQRLVIILYFIEKKSTQYIADTLKIKPPAVRDRIKKAIERVRRKEGIDAVGIPRGVYNCRTRRRGEDDV